MLSGQDLVAIGATVSYAVGVTDEALWAAIGQELARRRVALGYGSRELLKKERRASPVPNTMKTIEEGRVANIDSLERYCKAVGATTADIFRAVLDAADGLGPSFTDAELALVELFRAIPEGGPRAAWVELGRFVAEKAEARRALLDGA